MRPPATPSRRARRFARRYAAHAAAATLAAACQDTLGPSSAAPTRAAAGVAARPADAAVIPGQYIVLLADAVADPAGRARALAARHGGTVTHTFTSAARGFAARLPDAAVAALRADPDVRLVEPDRVVRVDDAPADPASAGAAALTATPAPWNLDRVDQRDLPLSGTYAPANAGAGVTAYMIGTGVRLTHAEFGGRAVSGVDLIDGGAADDCNGHGTHVAGTVGGAAYGVAKGVKLVAVRAIGCDGTGALSGVIAAIDWVTANRVRPAVAHLTTPANAASAALDDAVRRSVGAGVTYVYPAGTGFLYGGTGQDACAGSPSRVAEGIAVGVSDASDGEWVTSNYGPCVDLLAPGMYVESAGHQDDRQVATRTGGDMAAAHVTGAAALYLAAHPAAAPAEVASAILGNASTDKLALREWSVANGTPNRLLYVGFLAGTPPGNAAPTADFASSCAERTCTFTDASGDADGRVVAWSWAFGDGQTSAAQHPPAHTFHSDGTYTVTLTVTDDRGARSVKSRVVRVGPPPQTIWFEARALKDKGRGSAYLTWTGPGLAGANVDLYRNGVRVLTTPNDGSHTDVLGRVTGTYTYMVCDAGTAACSAPASVRF